MATDFEKMQKFVDFCVTRAIETRTQYDIDVAEAAKAAFEKWKETHKVPKSNS